MDLADAVAQRPLLGKSAYKLRVRRVVQGRIFQRVAAKVALGLKKTCREVIRRGGVAAGRGPKAAFCTILRPLQFRVGTVLQIPQWRYKRFSQITNNDDLNLPCLVFQSQSDRQTFTAPCLSPCLYRLLCSGG